MGRAPTIAALMLALLFACNHGGLTPDSSIFKGLPHSVVVEALANPTLQQNMQGESPASQDSLAQAAVRNMIFCREQLRVYKVWITTGSPPAVRPGPTPVHPLQPGAAAIAQDYSRLHAAIASGDPIELQTELTAEGSCGNWVPATPGNVQGPTISQVAQEIH